MTTTDKPATQRLIQGWWRAGWRSATLRAASPKGAALAEATPVALALLMLGSLALAAVLQRFFFSGPADFQPEHLLGFTWLAPLIAAWLCAFAAWRTRRDRPAPAASGLFAVLLAQGMLISLAATAMWLPLTSTGAYTELPPWAAWAVYALPGAWTALATSVLLLRVVGWRHPLRVLLVVGLACLPPALQAWRPPAPLWQERAEAREPAAPPMKLTQAVMEGQPRLLAEALQGLQPQRPGIVDIYAISFAPYADADVFRREAAMVDEVMRQRFDAAGRSLQFVNHRETAGSLPWATPANLLRAIQRIAAVMDRDEDVLFIHLTSHGARNGELAASFWPIDVEPVMPGDLRRWLEDAGIRWRVISISACYSGSWIEALATEGSLVMTAADATHTSYGCGRHSPLTFFGRAMFDEGLRRTHSFESAHAEARQVIERREKEAGKTDGYSNPQIAVGPLIRPVLERLVQRLEAPASATARP